MIGFGSRQVAIPTDLLAAHASGVPAHLFDEANTSLASLISLAPDLRSPPWIDWNLEGFETRHCSSSRQRS